MSPHLPLPQFMDEGDERELAMFMDLVLLGKCVEICVFGSKVRLSKGIKSEIGKAERRNMIIRYFTEGLKQERHSLRSGVFFR